MSTTDFLNRLPASVIRNGQVISIRSDINERLTGGKQAVQLVDTPALDRIRHNGRGQEITTLRIRGFDGNTWVLKMEYESTIGDVHKHIDQLQVVVVSYELRTTYPMQVC